MQDEFFFSSRRRHTRCLSDWSSDVCSSDLGRIVENVAGTTNEEYLTRNVLRPLAMTATVWRQSDVPPEHLARGYGRKRPSAPGPVVGDGLREEPQLDRKSVVEGKQEGHGP